MEESKSKWNEYGLVFCFFVFLKEERVLRIMLWETTFLAACLNKIPPIWTGGIFQVVRYNIGLDFPYNEGILILDHAHPPIWTY
jgi:hypothetical protein